MSFFAVLLALLLEQVKPLPRGNAIHDALTGWIRGTARNFDAGKDGHAWVVWCITVLVPSIACAAAYIGLTRANVLLGLAFDVARALPDARLSPVQPLLHRHPRRAGPRRRDRGAAAARRMAPPRRQRAAGERVPAPRDRAFAARRAPPCVRRLLLVRAAVELRPRAGRRGAVPARRVRRAATGRSAAAAAGSPSTKGLARCR